MLAHHHEDAKATKGLMLFLSFFVCFVTFVVRTYVVALVTVVPSWLLFVTGGCRD